MSCCEIDSTELIARRTLLARSGAALVGPTMLASAFGTIFATQSGEEAIDMLAAFIRKY